MDTYFQQSSIFKTGLTLSILAGFLLFSGACATVDTSGKKLLAQQKYEDSRGPGNTKQEKIKKLMEAIRMEPKEALYRVALGDVYFKDEQLEKAEKMYLSAIKVDPQFKVTNRMLGRLYMQKGQWDDAVESLERALNQPNVINPVQLYNWLAYSEYRKGDLNKAEKAWLRALDISDNDKVRMNLALIYKEGNRLDLAQASLLKVLEMNPKSRNAHFELGGIYYKRNKFKKAREHFKEVIQLEPLSEQAKVSHKYLKKLSIKK
jgi:Tfp pilus assembly protein PilF